MNIWNGTALTASQISTLYNNRDTLNTTIDDTNKIEIMTGGTTDMTVYADGADISGVVTATSFSGDGSNLTNIIIPTGGVIIWSNYGGVSVPNGYALCNGDNGTPDLSNESLTYIMKL